MGSYLDSSPPLRMEELLRHADWLRGLAAGLVGERGQAEDLVQETWLAALQRPPRAGASPRAWLGRVLRNLAHNRRRDERTRAEHEARVADPAPRPSPQAIAEEVEAQRLLAEAVGRLPDPGRTIVVLRYFRGLDSAAIGRELALPAGTVRWKLQAALEELRRELDRRFEGGRRAWSLVLARLLVAPAPAAALPWAMLAAASVLALGLGWWSLRPRPADSGPAESAVVASATARAPAVEPAPMVAEPSSAPAREPKRIALQASAAPAASRAVLPVIEGQVLVDGLEPGHPIGLRVRFRTQQGWLPGQIVAMNTVRKLVTDDNGRFDVSAVGSGCTFGLQAPGFALEADQPVEWETPAREIVLRLRTAPALRGRVVTPAGDPVPGARGGHWLRGKFSDGEFLLDPGEFRSDREARFEIPLLELLTDGPAEECAGTLLLEVPHVGRKLVELEPFPLADRDLGEIRLEPVRVLAFRVRDPLGQPLGGAVARLDDHWLSKPSSPTNAAGRGELRHAPDQRVRVRFSALGCVDQVLSVGVGEEPEVWFTAATVLEVQLEPPANSYAPFPGLTLSAQEPFLEVDPVVRSEVLGPNWIQSELGATPVGAHGSRRDQSGRFFHAYFQPDPGGRITIVGLVPGVLLTLEARDDPKNVLAQRKIVLAPGETHRIALRYGE